MKEYSEIEIDLFPNADWEIILQNFLRSLKDMAIALEQSSDMSAEGGAGFAWELKITAKGKWI